MRKLIKIEWLDSYGASSKWNAMEQCNGVMTIPKCSITKITTLIEKD